MSDRRSRGHLCAADERDAAGEIALHARLRLMTLDQVSVAVDGLRDALGRYDRKPALDGTRPAIRNALDKLLRSTAQAHLLVGDLLLAGGPGPNLQPSVPEE